MKNDEFAYSKASLLRRSELIKPSEKNQDICNED